MENGSSARERGLLELLIVVVRHLRLLVIVPLLVGITSFTIAYLQPPTYTSEAIVAMAEDASKQAALMMVTPLVIDSVIAQLQLASDKPLEQARVELIRRIRAKVARDGLLRLEVSASSPAQAQQLAQTLIEAWRATTVPGEQEKQELQARLAYVQKMLKPIDQLMLQLISDAPATADNGTAPGESGLRLVSLGELQAKYFTESHAIPRKLQGVSPEVVRQKPSLPNRPQPAGKSGVAILLTIATFLLLLIGVLVKHLLDRYITDERNSANLGRLRSAFYSGAKTIPSETAAPRH